MAKLKKLNENKSKKWRSASNKYESEFESHKHYDNISNDSNDSNAFDDEIDLFHKQKDKLLLKNSALTYNSDDESDLEVDVDDEVMPVYSDSDDQQSDDPMDRFHIEMKKDDMASDLDDDDEDSDGLPDASAWGKKKALFYNTDYVDKDFRKYKESEEQLAKYEEEEALAIQKRLLESMNETDLGINLWISDIEPTAVDSNRVSQLTNEESEQILPLNLEKLTEREKIDLLKKESPELEAIIEDYSTYMTEVRDKLLPIMMSLDVEKIEKSSGIDYIETRYQTIINYCINISFYLSLIAKRTLDKDHAVMKKLLAYKKLLIELNKVKSSNSILNQQIETLLDKISKGEDINLIINNLEANSKLKNSNKRVKFANDVETSEFETLKLISDENDKSLDISDDKNEEIYKRGITYQMDKNKGLTPKRKKEQRNPRVKHRMKYRKAKIRRRGQVREVRKQLHRYGGETSGIRSSVVKSVRFK